MKRSVPKVGRTPQGFNVIFDKLGNLSKEATQVHNPLKPKLASADYIINHINCGFSGNPDARDYCFGGADRFVNVRSWWQIDISLTYPDTEVGDGELVHYLFTVLPANSTLLHDMQLMANRLLLDLYNKLGTGKGVVYYSRILPSDVASMLADGTIIKDVWIDDYKFKDWTIVYHGDDIT